MELAVCVHAGGAGYAVMFSLSIVTISLEASENHRSALDGANNLDF
jgi:hypothetical protein